MSSHENENSGSTEQFLDCNGRAKLWPYQNPSIEQAPTLKSLFSKTKWRSRKGCGGDHKKLEPSTSSSTSSHNDPIPHKVSPPILVRGHGPHCPAHPLSPWPRGAARPRNRGLRQLPRAAVCCLGRKKMWHLKSQSFGTCGHSKSSLDLRNIVVLRCLEDIELVEKTVACIVLSKPCQPCLQWRCTWMNSNILLFWKTNTPTIRDTTSFENSLTVLFLCSWNRM